jgi:hypothetical protein
MDISQMQRAKISDRAEFQGWFLYRISEFHGDSVLMYILFVGDSIV